VVSSLRLSYKNPVLSSLLHADTELLYPCHMLTQNYCIHATCCPRTAVFMPQIYLLFSSAYLMATDLTLASDTVCGNQEN
jgi:hypothetical protein